MNALTNGFAAPGPAWIEMPPEFIDEFFQTDSAPRRARPVERRPGLGVIICAGFIGLFLGSAAVLVL